VRRSAIRAMRHRPRTIQRAGARVADRPPPAARISGPMPAGSPMVKAIAGQVLDTRSGIVNSPQVIRASRSPETAGIGRDGKSRRTLRRGENANRDPKNDFISTSSRFTDSARTADQEDAGISAGEHQGRGRRPRRVRASRQRRHCRAGSAGSRVCPEPACANRFSVRRREGGAARRFL